jgi:peptidyl-prolyl cis-trans isomerase B (cyclophilin B)
VSKARERAYERRRYEEWQRNLADRKRRRQQARRIALAVVSSVAAIGVMVGVTLLVTTSGDDPTSTASSPSASASASSAATAAPGGCTPSTLGTVASPKQTAKAPPKSLAAGKKWTLALDTTCGAITIELDGAKAPQAVSSTISLARSGFYDKTPCHRLTTANLFVLQCGDPLGTGSGGPGYQFGPVENAPKDGVYPAGTVAMARSNSQDSNGSQFFLVYKETTLPTDGGGYSVIGHITKGLDVVKKVAKSGTDDANGSGDGHPVTPISIVSTKVTQG